MMMSGKHVSILLRLRARVKKLTINSRHNEPNLRRIRRARKMGINLLILGLIQAHEAMENIVARLLVVLASLVVGEVVLHGREGKLFPEAIDLVEEENDGSLDEPARVADGVEEGEGFLHTVYSLVFEKKLVVLGDGDEEEDGGDVLETVDPLLALGTLSSDVEHAVGELANDEGCLSDTGGLDTGAEDILVRGEVVALGDALDGVKVANLRLALWLGEHGGFLTIWPSHSTDTLLTS